MTEPAGVNSPGRLRASAQSRCGRKARASQVQPQIGRILGPVGVNRGPPKPLRGRETTATQDHIDQFVLSLIRTGVLLTDVAADLAESLPADAYPGEDP